jgi:hypothetical protein
MKPYDMVSSFQGANTLFQGQQINRQKHRDRREKQKADKSRPQKTRSPEMQG